MAGKLLAITLCNGGSTGNCLSKAVFQYLAYGEETNVIYPTIDEVPDYEARDAVTKVNMFYINRLATVYPCTCLFYVYMFTACKFQ